MNRQGVVSVSSYAGLGHVVRQVGDHDLILGRNTVGRGATLTTLARLAGLLLAGLLLLVAFGGLVSDITQRLGLGISGRSIRSRSICSTVLLGLLAKRNVY